MNKLTKKISVTILSFAMIIGIIVPSNAQTDALANKSNDERINKNCSILNTKTGVLEEYDESGKLTETTLEGEALTNLIRSKTPKTRDFNSNRDVDIYYEKYPRNGVNVRSAHMIAPDEYINLQTYNFPGDLKLIDVYFTNEYGDDTKTCYDVEEYDLVWLRADYPTEEYVVRVSHYYGYDDVYYDVQLRAFTD
jgi:hypothetical protein